MSDEHDPSEPIPPADDLAIKRQRSDEADALFDPKGAFMLGVRGVRMRWYQQLMDTKDQATKDDLVTKSQVLDEVVNALNGFINDYKVALRNRR